VPDRSQAAVDEAGDVAMYRTIAARVRSGESYYVAVGEELRRGNYAVREVFNWRTPLFLRTLAKAGGAERVVLIALGLVLCGAMLAAAGRRSAIVKWSALVMQTGVLATLAVPNAVVMSEAWAGVFIGLSVFAYALGRAAIAVPLGVLALFVRELAAPYCVVCTLTAAVNRRWRETAAWIVAAGLYAAYYLRHLTQVWAHRLPTDPAHPSSWLEFGGLPLLLTKVEFQFWLLLAPAVATAFALILIVASLANSRAPVHLRLTTGAYLLFFLAAGKAFDVYWGMLAWPAWALACGYGMERVRDAIRALFRPRLGELQSAHEAV
jgi:hypothetical protein